MIFKICLSKIDIWYIQKTKEELKDPVSIFIYLQWYCSTVLDPHLAKKIWLWICTLKGLSYEIDFNNVDEN